jgi:hypothetical protein
VRKYRPPLTTGEIKELERLSNLDFSNYSEADVREEYLVPIMTMLGYRKELDYSVSREESFGLHKLFLSVGSKRVRLDYICSLRKQYFWLIDAKEGKSSTSYGPSDLKDEDIQQAYFYSLHHEVNCRYFAVSNGWYFNLYDRDELDEELTPLLSVQHKELRDRFLEIDFYIGSSQLLPNLKLKVLQHIEKVLSAETNLHRLDEFELEVERSCSKVRPIVLENFRSNARREQESREDSWRKVLASQRPYELVESCFQSAITIKDMDELASSMVENLIRGPGGSNHYLLFHKMFLGELKPVNYWHHLNTLRFLLELNDRNVEFVDFAFEGNKSSVKHLLSYWISLLLNHFESRDDLRLMWAFEGLCYRFLKFILLLSKTSRDAISRSVEYLNYLLPEENIAWLGPSAASNLLRTMEIGTMRVLAAIIERYYDKNSRSIKKSLALQEYKQMHKQFNELVALAPFNVHELERELGGNWGEITFLADMNFTFDPIMSGACELLKRYPNVVAEIDDANKQRIGFAASLKCAPYAETFCEIFGIRFVNGIELEQRKLVLQAYFDPTLSPKDFSLDQYFR